MRIHELITNNISEDASAGAVDASSVNPGGIAFPLFGPKKMARRAVDPMGYTTPKKKKKNPQPYTKKVKDIYPNK
jgi:hypothetical protein